MGKNLQKVQDMLDGNFQSKIQVGYSKTEERREIGDRWFDSDGKEWEQKDGYISSVSKTPARGIFDKVCKDCDICLWLVCEYCSVGSGIGKSILAIITP